MLKIRQTAYKWFSYYLDQRSSTKNISSQWQNVWFNKQYCMRTIEKLSLIFKNMNTIKLPSTILLSECT